MKKQIAEVAIPISLSLNESFDYLIPQNLEYEPRAGSRVLVPFGKRRLAGYVTRIKQTSAYEKRLKAILANLDPQPLITPELFELAAMIRDRYFCSYADALHTVLPSAVKSGRQPKALSPPAPKQKEILAALSGEETKALSDPQIAKPAVLIWDQTFDNKWLMYAALIKKTLTENKSVIFLVPDHAKITNAISRLEIGIEPIVISSSIGPGACLKSWLSSMDGKTRFVVGTRSAVFAPVQDLGLIIIDEEDHFAYRQDQVPHYRTYQIAMARCQKHSAQLVLGGFFPSLDTFSQASGAGWGMIKYTAQDKNVAVKLIDTSQERRFKGRERILSGVLEHRIADCLERKEKLLIFANKKGFSTFLYCKRCKSTQTCPRCSASLVYHFKTRSVTCPKCSYDSAAPDLCPGCKSAYVKYFGYGIEKAESELLRLFPSARIQTYERGRSMPEDYDIMLTTQALLEHPLWNRYAFDTVAVLGCEQMLGAVDFRSTEKTFSKLLRLLFLAKKELVIQTTVTENNALAFLQKNDAEGFLEQELKVRQEWELPPVIETGLLAIRSSKQDKAAQEAQRIFNKLNTSRIKQKGTQVFEPMASMPLKVRGTYRYHILVKSRSIDTISKQLRNIIENPRHNVIVTFDPSPL